MDTEVSRWDGENRRLLTRFLPKEGLLARTTDRSDSTVLDLSMGGCRVAADIQVGTNTRIQFRRTGQERALSTELEAKVINRFARGDHVECGLEFKSLQRLEEARQLVAHLSDPRPRQNLDPAHLERQRELAKQDLDQLFRRMAGLKESVQRFILTALTLLAGLASVYFALISKTDVQTPMRILWLSGIAIGPAMVGFVLLAMTIEAIAELKRYGAVAIILQRGLVNGALPLRYRGWEDAYANYSRRWKCGTLEPSTSKPPPKQPLTKYMISMRWFPADALFAVAMGLFAFIMPATTFILLGIHLWAVLGTFTQGALILTGVVVVILLLAIYGPAWRRLRDLYDGPRSSNYSTIVFSEILGNDDPIDPHGGQPPPGA